jgi:Uma2 family endonuclease
MAVVNRISEQAFLELLLNDPDRDWELWDGVPRERPQMSMRHNAVAFRLGHCLQNQLDMRDYQVNVHGDHTRISSRSYYIPDVIVIPTSYQLPFEHDLRAIGTYPEPLPLVAEVWSPSTGHYDVVTKLKGYQERGDLEIWYIHPGKRTLTAWRRQPDSSYSEELFRGGVIPVASLPGVVIDLDQVLDGQR